MARGVNKVILIGHLGQDPETRYTQSGAAVTNFSLATSESWNDKQTGNKEERTEWHRLVGFKKLAEICEKYLQKGTKIYAEGSLRTRRWQDQSGQDRYTTEIVMRDMQILSGGRRQEEQQPAPSQTNKADHHPPAFPQGEVPGSFDTFDDDIPF